METQCLWCCHRDVATTTYLALSSSEPLQDNGQQNIAILYVLLLNQRVTTKPSSHHG